MEVAGEGALPSPTATMVVAAEEKCEGNSKTQRQRELRKKKKKERNSPSSTWVREGGREEMLGLPATIGRRPPWALSNIYNK